MDRRNFMRSAGVAAVAAPALAAPAIAQSMPELKWRMTSSFPKALDTIYGAAETFARFVAEATDAALASSPDVATRRLAAWCDFCHALLCSAEFAHLE